MAVRSPLSGWRGALRAGALALLLAWAGPAPAQERALLVVEQGAHSAPVRRLAVDERRGLLVTASDDRTARVWDLASGEPRQVLRPLAFGAEGGRLYGAAIHPSEPLVAVAGTTGGEGRQHLIYLFDLDSGALRRSVDAQAGDIRKLAWTADGSVLLAAYNGTNGVRAFALDGRPLLDDRFGGPVFGLATAANGLAAAVGLDGRLRVYRAGGGAAERLLDIATQRPRPAGVAFSPDGSRIAVAYAQRGEAPELFDAASGRPLARLELPRTFAGDFRVIAWSADSRSIFSGGTAHTRELAFPIVQHDAATGRVVAQVEVARDSVTDLVALPSGELGYTSFDASWGVLRDGRVARRSAPDVATVRGDAPEDLELSDDALAARWGMRGPRGGFGFRFEKRAFTLGPRQALRPPETRFSALNAPSDWKNSAGPPVIGGQRMRLAADERPRALAILRSAPAAAVLGTNRALVRVDEQGRPQWRVPVDTEVRAVHGSADGRLIVSAMADGTLRWWRATDGTLLLTLLVTGDGRWVAWTPSGYYDASAGADQIVGWALGRGQQQAMSFYSLSRFRDRFNRPDVIDTVLRTLDEKTAFATIAAQEEAARQAAIRDAQARAEAARAAERAAAERAEQAKLAAERESRAQLAAEQAAREAAAQAEQARLADARREAAQSQAQAQAEREAARREAELRAQAAREAAAREQAGRQAALEAQRLAAEAQAARDTAAREAELRELVAREAAREAEAREAAARNRRLLAELKATEFPPALLTFDTQRVRTRATEVTLPFAVSSAGGAGEVRLEVRINGRPVDDASLMLPQALDGATRGFAKVPIGPGASLVEIIAVNRYGASEPLSFRVEREIEAAARAASPGGDLYVLAIGVSEYARADYRLGLPAKDARDFAAAMRGQEGKQYRRVIVRTLTDREATRAAIAREFEWLRGAVGASDVAMLFMAGHGLNDSSGQYFFLPFDGNHERLMASAIAQTTIVSTLSKIRGKTLFFVDTCFAGNSLGALSRASYKTEKMINDLSASENGVVVFASSTGQEESEEKDEWGNGAFTKAVIEGLAGKADFTRAGRVTYAALNLFVSEEVIRLTEGRQRPVFISPRGIPDFALARL